MTIAELEPQAPSGAFFLNNGRLPTEALLWPTRQLCQIDREYLSSPASCIAQFAEFPDGSHVLLDETSGFGDGRSAVTTISLEARIDDLTASSIGAIWQVYRAPVGGDVHTVLQLDVDLRGQGSVTSCGGEFFAGRLQKTIPELPEGIAEGGSSLIMNRVFASGLVSQAINGFVLKRYEIEQQIADLDLFQRYRYRYSSHDSGRYDKVIHGNGLKKVRKELESRLKKARFIATTLRQLKPREVES